MKTIDEIRHLYPFFIGTEQPSCGGEIFINRHSSTADIIKVGYRDEIEGCTIKSGLPIAEIERWYLNFCNEYDRINTAILRFVDSHPTLHFNVNDFMECSPINEYGNIFAECFSKLPLFKDIDEALHIIRLDETLGDSLRCSIEKSSAQFGSLVDCPIIGGTIYPIGKISSDSSNVIYIIASISEDDSMHSQIMLLNAYKEHIYFTLVIDTYLEKTTKIHEYCLKSFSSVYDEEKQGICPSTIKTLYNDLDDKLKKHGIIAEPYGRCRKYMALSNSQREVHILPTFISPWGVNLCAAIHKKEGGCIYVGYTNMSYAAENCYYTTLYNDESLDRLSKLILKELL